MRARNENIRNVDCNKLWSNCQHCWTISVHNGIISSPKSPTMKRGIEAHYPGIASCVQLQSFSTCPLNKQWPSPSGHMCITLNYANAFTFFRRGQCDAIILLSHKEPFVKAPQIAIETNWMSERALLTLLLRISTNKLAPSSNTAVVRQSIIDNLALICITIFGAWAEQIRRRWWGRGRRKGH